MAKRVELHGHRGARGLWAENTLEGFRRTIALGVDAIEMDVALTRDGVAVVTHDPALNPNLTRGPDGAWLATTGTSVLEMTAAELGGWDVGRLRPGTAYAANYPGQEGFDGARIPTLAEVFALDGRVIFNIETKSFPDRPGLSADGVAMARSVLAAADTAGVAGRIIVQSFDWRTMHEIRRTRPEIARSYLTRTETVRAAALWWDAAGPEAFGGSVPRAVAAVGGTSWGPEFVDLTAEAVAEAHALGLKVRPWTVNDPAVMERFLDWGVDGLITDRPDIARAIMAARGMDLPPPAG
jgi:glycerophosphoryl diester phosphodiesterase